MLEILYHHAKFGGARISPATGVAKSIEFFTGSIARSASRRYLICSEADFEARCTDEGEIWHGGGDLQSPSSMPIFTLIGSTTRV